MIELMSPSRAAQVASVVAIVAVAAIVILSGVNGYRFWMEERGDWTLAWLTIAAEIVAFAGLVIARENWARSKAWASAGIALTLLAAAWCGWTMYEKVAADGRAAAAAEAQETLAYRMAARDLEDASQALRVKLAEAPPERAGPQTIAAWEASQAAAVARLEAARDNAQARIDAATPAPQFSVEGVVRGVGVEFLKLFGFAAFSILSTPADRRKRAPPKLQPRPAPPRTAKAAERAAKAAAAAPFLFVSNAAAIGPMESAYVGSEYAGEDPLLARLTAGDLASLSRDELVSLAQETIAAREAWTHFQTKEALVPLAYALRQTGMSRQQVAEALSVTERTITRHWTDMEAQLQATA